MYSVLGKTAQEFGVRAPQRTLIERRWAEDPLAILDRAQAELGSTPEAQREIAETRALYALVGTRAAPVQDTSQDL